MISDTDVERLKVFLIGGGSLIYANLTLQFKNESESIIGMEKFAGLLKSVDCSNNPLVLEFKDNATFTSAKQSWSWVSQDVNNTFVLVANYEGCGPDGERQPYLVNNITFDPEYFKIFLEAQQKEWQDVAKTYSFNMGYRPSLNSSNSSAMAKRDEDFTLSLASNLDRNLFSKEVNGIDLSLDCVHCGTSGSLLVDFHLDVDWFDTTVIMKVSPQEVAAYLQLALSAQGTLSNEYNWQDTIISIPIEGIEAGSFAKIGAFLEVDVGFTIGEWSGEVDATFGAQADISNSAVVEVNLRDLDNGKFSGWNPNLTPIPFTVTAEVGGSVEIYAQAAISLTAEAFGEGIDMSIDLKMPYIDADLTAMANTGGICGTMQTIGVNVDASVGVDLSVQVAAAGNEANPLWSQTLLDDSWPLFDKCFAFGPDNAQSAAPPMAKPPKKSRPPISKTTHPIKALPSSVPVKTLIPVTTKRVIESESQTKLSKTTERETTPTLRPKSSNSKPISAASSSAGSKISQSQSSEDRSTSSAAVTKSSAITGSITASIPRSKSSTNGPGSSSEARPTKSSASSSSDGGSSSLRSSSVSASVSETNSDTSRASSGTASSSGSESVSKTGSDTSRGTKTSSAGSATSTSSQAAYCRLNRRGGGDSSCDADGHTHITTTTSTVTALTTPKVTCSGQWTQACYNYR
jgi:hypothetical protein